MKYLIGYFESSEFCIDVNAGDRSENIIEFTKNYYDKIRIYILNHPKNKESIFYYFDKSGPEMMRRYYTKFLVKSNCVEICIRKGKQRDEKNKKYVYMISDEYFLIVDGYPISNWHVNPKGVLIDEWEGMREYLDNMIGGESDREFITEDLKGRFMKVKDRPSIDVLKKDIEELGYRGIGKKYGVSDNAVRKWVK
jgi:hypothetical protein